MSQKPLWPPPARISWTRKILTNSTSVSFEMKLIIKTLHKNSGQIILKLFIFITLLIGATYIGISLQQKSTLQVQASTDTCAYQGGYCALGRDCKTSFIDDDNYCSKLHGSKYGCCIRDSGPPRSEE